MQFHKNIFARKKPIWSKKQKKLQKMSTFIHQVQKDILYSKYILLLKIAYDVIKSTSFVFHQIIFLQHLNVFFTCATEKCQLVGSAFTAKYTPIRTWAESKAVILLFIKLKLHKWWGGGTRTNIQTDKQKIS